MGNHQVAPVSSDTSFRQGTVPEDDDNGEWGGERRQWSQPPRGLGNLVCGLRQEGRVKDKLNSGGGRATGC